MRWRRFMISSWVTCCMLGLALGCGFALRQDRSLPAESSRPAFHHSTQWEVRGSTAYDALCFLNVLTGDPFYLRFYQSEYDSCAPRLDPQTVHALAELMRKVKLTGGNVSPYLTYFFSPADPESLPDLLRMVENPVLLYQQQEIAPHYSWSKSGRKLFEESRPDLEVALQYLLESDFPAYWEWQVGPLVAEKTREIEPMLSRYDVVSQVETLLGHPLPSERIAVYLLYFVRPHGLKISGTRFLIDLYASPEDVVAIAAHEMMHPPYDLARDRELRTALNTLKDDEFLMEKVAHHDPSFGYNTFEGFVEENVVKAFGQVVAERLGVDVNPWDMWESADNGMHVLAPCVYYLTYKLGLGETETIRDFLVRAIRTGALRAGAIQGIYAEFYELRDVDLICRTGDVSAPMPPPQNTPQGVLFRFYCPRARTVQLMGDWPWNDWGRAKVESDSTEIGIMTPGGDGIWQRSEKLQPGTYMYKFRINGRRWVADPNNPVSLEDSYGGYNSVITVK